MKNFENNVVIVMKKILVPFLLFFILFAVTASAEEEKDISVVVNDRLISREQGQIDIVDGTAYISMNFLQPVMNIDLYWMNAIQQVHLNKDEKVMVLNLQDRTLSSDWLNIKRYMVVSKNNDIMVPIRFVAEYFGYQVNFNAEGPIITLTDPEKTAELGQEKKIQEDERLKVVYLTFDDGPSQYTDELLNLLDEYHMKATFFMLDGAMKANPEMVKQIAARGHGVGLHGVSHKRATFYSKEESPLKEMEQANATLESIVGFRSCLIRTPYGSSPYLTEKQFINLASYNYRIWDWNIDSKDWAYKNSYKTFYTTIKSIKTCPKEPKVILFHDMKNVVQTLSLFLKWMSENGYTSKEITPDLVPVKMTQKKQVR